MVDGGNPGVGSRDEGKHTGRTYFRCGGVVSNQIKKGLLLCLPWKNIFKSINIWQNYEQGGGYLLHFMCLGHYTAEC